MNACSRAGCSMLTLPWLDGVRGEYRADPVPGRGVRVGPRTPGRSFAPRAVALPDERASGPARSRSALQHAPDHLAVLGGWCTPQELANWSTTNSPRPPSASGSPGVGGQPQQTRRLVRHGQVQQPGHQLQPQPQRALGVDDGVGDQFAGHQHGPVDQPSPHCRASGSFGSSTACSRHRRGRGRTDAPPAAPYRWPEWQLGAQVRRATGMGEGLLEVGCAARNCVMPRRSSIADTAGEAQHTSTVGRGPAAGGMVGDAGQHVRTTDPSPGPDGSQITATGRSASRLSSTPKRGHRVQVELADRGQDGAAIPGGLVDPHGTPPVAVWFTALATVQQPSSVPVDPGS